mgnify:FL=1
MTISARRHLWPLAIVVLAIVVVVAALPGLREQFAQSARIISPMAVLVTLPGQVLAFLLCAAALSALRPGVSFRSSLASRVLRDAGGNLLVFFPGLGEAIGARALVLSGGTTRAAITASTLDVIAEGIAQIPYALLAVVVLPQLLHPASFRFVSPPIVAIVVALLGIAMLIGWIAVRSAGPSRLIERIRTEWTKSRADWATRRRGMVIAIILHFIAWAIGGLQLWAAAQVLGIPLDLFPAIVIESAAYAARAIIFFIPAGLAVQEGALIFACAAFGIGTVPALALALVLRLRDVICGLPLLYWPMLEYRNIARTKARN